RNHADNGEHLFFADRNVGLLQVPLGGTTPSTITSGQANLSAPIADGGLLYYFDGDNGGVPACTNNWSLQKVDAAPGSTPTTLIPAPMPCPQNLTMDDDSLYWVNQNTGTIMKMAKPLP